MKPGHFFIEDIVVCVVLRPMWVAYNDTKYLELFLEGYFHSYINNVYIMPAILNNT